MPMSGPANTVSAAPNASRARATFRARRAFDPDSRNRRPALIRSLIAPSGLLILPDPERPCTAPGLRLRDSPPLPDARLRHGQSDRAGDPLLLRPDRARGRPRALA